MNSSQWRISKAKRIKKKLENVEEYVHSYAFAITNHDRAHQEHFREQALAWCRLLLAELESSA